MSSPTHLSNFVNHLYNKFSLKDLGTLSYFLGVEVIPHSHGVLFSQRKYILDILTKSNMSDCKPISTPITASTTLTLKGGSLHPSPTEYHTLVGALQYLSLTRTDISLTMNRFTQF